jgi:hypothetical protein
MAKEAALSRHEGRFKDMADAWRRLADEAERFEELIRDMDQAFDCPDAERHASRTQRRSH